MEHEKDHEYLPDMVRADGHILKPFCAEEAMPSICKTFLGKRMYEAIAKHSKRSMVCRSGRKARLKHDIRSKNRAGFTQDGSDCCNALFTYKTIVLVLPVALVSASPGQQ